MPDFIYGEHVLGIQRRGISMVLAIDIGNTHVVVGLFSQDQLLRNWRLSSSANRTEDECWALLTYLAEAEGMRLQDIKGCIISSVVPNITFIFQKMVHKRLHLTPLNVSATLPLDITIHYKDPTTVGADRICNAVAGYEKFGGPLIIVDFGTATTFDVISQNGDYLGGIIAPGIETSLQTLHYRAARLMKVELKFPDKVIGDSTETSMQSGLMFGTVELVKGLIGRIRRELGCDARVVATGGLATTIKSQLESLQYHEPNLTLHGLHLLYKKMHQQEA